LFLAHEVAMIHAQSPKETLLGRFGDLEREGGATFREKEERILTLKT